MRTRLGAARLDRVSDHCGEVRIEVGGIVLSASMGHDFSIAEQLLSYSGIPADARRVAKPTISGVAASSDRHESN